MAASSGKGASITSGGGFSALHSQPSFQKDVVAAYFSTAAAAGQSALAGYSPAGRGFPDVSLAGENYVILVGGSPYTISGTSASAPVMAGFISNINAARIAAGKGSVGWINPALYTNASMFINDITSGDNKCGAQAEPDKFGCCSQGFFAAPGWDPVTGLGSVNYGEMESLFLSLGVVNGLNLAPLKSPIASPTAAVKGAPTMEPTISTQSGPQEPSLSPSPSSSRTPLRTPKESQSRTPTLSKGPPHTSPFSFPSLSNEGPSRQPFSVPSRLSTASPTQNPTQTGDSKSTFQCKSLILIPYSCVRILTVLASISHLLQGGVFSCILSVRIDTIS